MPLQPVRRRIAALAGAGVLAIAGIGIAPAPTVLAIPGGSVIHVNDSGDAVADDGLCSWNEALIAADTDAAIDACAAGTGADVIVFDVSSVTITTAPHQVTSALTVDGNLGATWLGGSSGVLDVGTGGTVSVLGVGFLGSSGTPAVIQNAGTLALDNAYFSSNTTTGGLIRSSGTLTVAHTNAGSGSSADGALYLTGTTTISDSSFLGLSSTTAGAPSVVNALDGTTSIARSWFNNNTTTVSGGQGGAVRVGALAGVTITQSLLNGNIADAGGGAIYVDGGTLTLANSTVFDNHTTTGSGGGLLVHNGTASLYNDTIASNQSFGLGGGVAIDLSTVSLGNTLLVGNQTVATPSAPQPSFPSPAPTPKVDDGYNLAGAPAYWVGNQIHSATTGVVESDPNDHGGPTNSMALPAGSPAVDAGDATVCGLPPVDTVDQRGYARADGLCDVGAYERDTEAPTVTNVPAPKVGAPSVLKGTAVPVRVTWAVTDPGNSGYSHAIVERQQDGGAWTTVNAAAPGLSLLTWIPTGHATRFRVWAVDHDGNTSAAALTSAASVTPTLVQQGYAGITYRGTWTTAAASVTAPFSGGSARYATAAGASASLTFTGRGVAWVTTKGPRRGVAYVYVNGVKDAVIDLSATTNQYRVVAWQKSWAATRNISVKIVVVGTAGRPRVDLDAFIQLR